MKKIDRDNPAAYKTKVSPLRVAFLLLAIVAVYYLATKFGDFNAIWGIIIHSSWWWILASMIMMWLAYIMTAVVQYAAGDNEGSVRELVKLEFAGSFLNHFLPYSFGGIGLVSEYYRKLGHNRPKAIALATIPIIVSVITTIIIALIVSPATVTDIAKNLKINLATNLVIAIIVALLVAIIIAVFFFRKKLKKLFKETISELKCLKDVRQLLKVAMYSTLLTIILSLVLYTSILAINCNISFLVVIAIYISSLLASEVAPTPSGVGATEAVLVLGLAGAGLTTVQALSATLLFRFMSYLLPIIPGAIALLQVNRNNRLMHLKDED